MFGLSRIKRALVADNRQRRKVRLGLYRGLMFDASWASDAQFLLGLQERETHTRIRRALARARWAIDVGAGNGELTVLLAKRGTRVYAFEPENVNRVADALNRNCSRAQSAGVDVSPCFVGLGDHPTITALDALHLLHPHAFGFVKIDVENAELDVLKSGSRLLSGMRGDVLVEVHSMALERQCQEWLRGHGFTVEVLRNAWWRIVLPERRPTAHNRWLWATKD